MLKTKHLRHIPSRQFSAETLVWRDNVLANGGTFSVSTMDAVEKFVQDCKNNSIWDKLIEVGLFAGDNLNAALVKLKVGAGAPSLLTNINFLSGDYLESGATAGLSGNGTSKYLNTGLAATNLADLGHLSFYLREDVGASGNRSLLGVMSGTDQLWLGGLSPTVDVTCRYGQNNSATAATPLNKGFYLASRNSLSDLKVYRNAQLLVANGTTVTVTKPSANLFIFALSVLGSASAFLPAKGSFYSVGQSMSDTECQLFYNAVQTFQQTLNRAV